MATVQGFTPAYSITGLGDNFTTTIAPRVIGILINDETALGPAAPSNYAEVELDDRDAAIPLSVPSPGQVLTFSIGYKETGLKKVGGYTVDELQLEGPERRVIIRGRTADTIGSETFPRAMAIAYKSWDRKTIGQIAAELAKKHGWSLKIDPSLSSVFIQHVDQAAESDMAFLLRIAQGRPDGAIKIQNESAVIFKTGSGVSATGKGIPTISVTPSDVISWRSIFAKRAAHRRVQASFHDIHTATLKTVTAQSPDASEEDSTTSLPYIHPDEDTAMAAAQAKVNAIDRGSESVSLTIVGNPKIWGETKLVLSGFHRLVDRTWVANRVRHRISDAGYVTEIDCVKQL